MQDRKRALAWCVLVLLVGLPAVGATVESIPKPEAGTWTVDTTGRLRAETLAELNRIGTQVNASGQGQLVVVMVDSTEGRQPRAFATELFNRWGIGNADRDDGALLFIAMEDRKVEIVLGDGVDSAEDIQRSDAVMASIIPLFKQGDADSGVLEGARGLTTLLAQHSPRLTPATGMSLGGGSTVMNQLSSATSSQGSGGSPLFGFGIVAAIVTGILVLASKNKNSRGPWKRPPTFWGGGGYFGGSGSSGGGGGGGFGGGSSSGGGSSGSF